MKFPAYCKDKDTKALIYISKDTRFKPHQHEYVRPIEMETLEEIESKASNDHDVFMALKSKGWSNLTREERVLYQQLKLTEAQLLEPIQK